MKYVCNSCGIIVSYDLIHNRKDCGKYILNLINNEIKKNKQIINEHNGK